MSHPSSGLIAAILSASLLAGCATAPGTPPRSTVAIPGQLADSEAVRSDAPPSNWWRLYNEPALDVLVEEALTNNRDLRAASANLLQARSILSEARGELWPATNLSGGAGEGSTLEDQIAAASEGTDKIRTGPRFDIGTSVSWELDLFGRLRSTVKAAEADAQASAALEDGVRVAVAAGVTGTWLDACGYAHRADVARQSLALAQRGLDLAERLLAAGSGLPVDVLRAEVLVGQASATIPMLDAKRHDALTELAVLTGRPPAEVPSAAAACRRLPAITTPLPIGNGLTLLRRRPDVRAAERKLAANTARIGVAVADLYPRISLDGGAALSSPTVGGIASRNNLVWRVGPLLSWSFPNVSAVHARIRYAQAGEAAGLADFDATILRALKEVNQTAEDYGAALRRQGDLRAAADHSARADRLMQIQRSAGAATALEALDAERADIDAQAALAAADSDVTTTQVALFKALGGGWENAPAVVLPSPQRTAPVASVTGSSK
ncbi:MULTISPECIES: efflux transporter outer membrane subunit [Nitrospirillum]|uniref:NodT family efflux transporter outer membrane factor (OMF) lipoprotein n=1 Tax=Nitrospirillum amazonense TaxID=28077 RepID=A0A560FNJ2_9PROT|nr:TolC family protein [Nitrospirillum amazonense]MEC4593836.1 TolC family protein [Nitrospirillum amazonense]TWB23186.1 NodT family efflux transporter outer membrane factor (OMF) lipoprotein [Nitrospirillum amazonense]